MDSTNPHADLIEDYLAHLRYLRRSPDTIKTWGSVLRRAHRELPYGLPMATEEELIEWLGRCRTARTQSCYTTAIKGFFRWALQKRRLDFDPASELPSPKVPKRLPRPATPEQVARILTETPEPVRLWATIAAYAGARCIEIAQLRREHITEQWVTLLGKGDKERRVPTHPALWAAVRDLPPGPITTATKGEISRRSWATFRRLGIQTSLHPVRAALATTALQATGDLAAVQDILGHASPATTRIYASPSEAQMRAAIQAVPTVPVVTAGG